MGSNQFSFSSKLVLVTVVIGVAAVFSISAVRNSNIYLTDESAAVGKLAAVDGEVQIRSEDGEFRRVNAGQTVADGDQIVTGKDSKAVIDLNSGRKASCLSNSRITVTSLEDHRIAPTILIDATRAGQAEASTTDNRANPVILLTGNGAVTVNAGESVATKSSGASGPAEVTKTNTKTGVKITIAKVDDADRSRRIQENLAVVATPTPTATPKPTPKPAPVKIDLSAKLLSPAPGSSFWTTTELEKLSNEFVSFVVSLKAVPTGASIALELRQESKGGAKGLQEKLVPATDPGKYTARVPVANILANSTRTIISGTDRRTLSLAIVISDGSTANRAPIEGRVTIASLAPLAKQSNIVVGLQSLGEAPQISPWIAGRFQQDPDKLPLVIRLFKPGLLAPLMPSLRSSPSVSAESGATIAAAGTFVVKNQEIIAQISGNGTNNELTDKVRGLIDGDFVFTGPQDALVSAQKYSVDEIQKMIAGSVQNGKSIYVFQDQSLFQVNAEFVRKYPSVASFVRRNSNAFFTRQVKINSFR
ncbi:MAG: hypothetical protein RIQ81_1739 [Pseudomonadota bacterium]|jgi:hypothetical protein